LVGREASRVFLTGDLNSVSEENMDLNNLTDKQRIDLEHWVEYFTQEYPQVGYLMNWQSPESGRRRERRQEHNHP